MPIEINELVNKISDALKKTRKGNNAKNNCAPLTKYTLEALKASLENRPFKKRKVSTNSSFSSPFVETHVTIDTDVKSKKTRPEVSESCVIVKDKGLFSLLKDKGTSAIHRQKVLRPQDLNEALMNLAKSKGGVVYGDVAFAGVLEEEVEHVESGHVLAFCATADKVFYIDGQFYDGIKGTGEPIFTDITKAYPFFDEDNPSHLLTPTAFFQPACFYLDYGTVKTELHGKLELKETSFQDNPSCIITKDTTIKDLEESATKKNIIRIEKDAKPEVISNLPKKLANACVDLNVKSISPDLYKFLPPYMQNVFIGEDTAPNVLASMPKNIKRVMVGGDISFELLNAMPASVDTIAISKSMGIDKLKVLPKNIKRIILWQGMTPELVKALPASVANIVINPTATVEAVKAIPESIRVIEIVADVNLDLLKAIPDQVKFILIGNISSQTAAALPGTVRKVIIGSTTNPSAVRALPLNVELVILANNVTKEAVQAIPEHITSVNLAAALDAKIFSAFPPHISNLLIESNIPKEMVVAIPSTIKTVTISSPLPNEILNAMPSHIELQINKNIPLEMQIKIQESLDLHRKEKSMLKDLEVQPMMEDTTKKRAHSEESTTHEVEIEEAPVIKKKKSLKKEELTFEEIRKQLKDQKNENRQQKELIRKLREELQSVKEKLAETQSPKRAKTSDPRMFEPSAKDDTPAKSPPFKRRHSG